MYSRGQLISIYLLVSSINLVMSMIYIGHDMGAEHANAPENAWAIGLLWPLYLLFLIPYMVWASLSSGTYLAGEYKVNTLEEGLLVSTCTFVGLFISWFLIADETGVPPGIRFFANFYRHPANRQIDRALGERGATFDGPAFDKSLHGRGRGKWSTILEREELDKIRERAAAEQERLAKEAERLRQRNAEAYERERKKMEEETRHAQAEREILEKMRQMEMLKAEIDELRKKGRR